MKSQKEVKSENKPVYFLTILDSGEFVAGITSEGKVDLSPNYSPEHAARIFWESLEEQNPLRLKVIRMESDIQDLRGINSKLNAEVNKLIREITMLKMKNRND